MSSATGVTKATTKFQSQWFAVEMDDMAILSLMGAISVQYRKLAIQQMVSVVSHFWVLAEQCGDVSVPKWIAGAMCVV